MQGFNPVFGRRGPENSLVPHCSGPRLRSVVELPMLGTEAQELLEIELGFHSERSALREQADAEFDLARGAEHLGRTTLDADMFVETVSQTWWMSRRSALAAFSSAVPGGTTEGRMNRHQYLLLREAFVHGENIDHPVIKKLRLTAIWHRADVDHNGLITHDELINWLRHLCSGDSHVRAHCPGRHGSLRVGPSPSPKPHPQSHARAPPLSRCAGSRRISSQSGSPAPSRGAPPTRLQGPTSTRPRCTPTRRGRSPCRTRRGSRSRRRCASWRQARSRSGWRVTT